MMIGRQNFTEVVLADFEFSQPPGERPRPVCLVAKELVSGHTHRIFQEELLAMKQPPYPIGPDCLFVAYYASAEITCHLVLGWPVPCYILDLFTEFRTATNGRRLSCGNGLLGALVYHGLDAIAVTEKQEMRQLAIRGGPYTAEERNGLLIYCESDVVALEKLLPAMIPNLDVERGLLRGSYMAAAGTIEHNGIPIDTESLNKLQAEWDHIKDRLIKEVDADYGVYEGRTFKTDRWAQWLIANNIAWPALPTGRLALDDDTFRDVARAYPVVAPIRELRYALSQMRLHELSVGFDHRNRIILSVLRARTGRNQPSNARFIFGSSTWIRGLIRPEAGYCLAYIDWSQQEFGIAAALSGDAAMIEAYRSEDPYLTFAKQAGAAPDDATKALHGAVREQFKTCALGTLYNMGAGTLAARTGLYIPYAADLLRKHHETYPQFWRWSDRVLSYALLHNHLYTVFGWNLFIEGEPNPNSIRNFPMQANASEMLRLACCLAIQRGVKVVAPVHDALLIEAAVGDMVGAIVTARRAMQEASRIVLGNLELRTDVSTIRHPSRYMDKRGLRMWNLVWKIINALEKKT